MKLSRFVPSHQYHAEETKPLRVLTTYQLAAMMFIATVGGAYGLEGCVGAGGALYTIIGILAVSFFWGIPTALAMTELSCSLPSNAGATLWLSVTFPRWFVFVQILWTLVQNISDNGLYPILFADYIGGFVELVEWQKAALKVGLIATVSALNILGIDLVGHVSIGLTLLVCAPFVMLFFLAVPQFGVSWAAVAATPAHVNWTVFLAILAWNCSGFENIGNLTEEVQLPEKAMFRGLLGSLGLQLLVYIPPVLAGVTVAPMLGDWVDGFWTPVAQRVGGNWFATVMALCGIASSVGFSATMLATTSRALSGMGSIQAFPAPISNFFAKLSPTYATPVNAIIVSGILSSLFATLLSFDSIVMIDETLYSLKLLALYVAVIKLRWQHPNLLRPFHATQTLWGLIVVLAPSILFSVFMFGIMMSKSRETCIVVGSWIVITTLLAVVYGSCVKQGELLGHIETYEGAEGDPSAASAKKDPGYGTV